MPVDYADYPPPPQSGNAGVPLDPGAPAPSGPAFPGPRPNAGGYSNVRDIREVGTSGMRPGTFGEIRPRNPSSFTSAQLSVSPQFAMATDPGRAAAMRSMGYGSGEHAGQHQIFAPPSMEDRDAAALSRVAPGGGSSSRLFNRLDEASERAQRATEAEIGGRLRAGARNAAKGVAGWARTKFGSSVNGTGSFRGNGGFSGVSDQGPDVEGAEDWGANQQ